MLEKLDHSSVECPTFWLWQIASLWCCWTCPSVPWVSCKLGVGPQGLLNADPFSRRESLSQWCCVFQSHQSHQKAVNMWFSLLVAQDLVPFSSFCSSVIRKTWPGRGPSRKFSKSAAVRLASAETFWVFHGAGRVVTESIPRSSASSFVLFPQTALPENTPVAGPVFPPSPTQSSSPTSRREDALLPYFLVFG